MICLGEVRQFEIDSKRPGHVTGLSNTEPADDLLSSIEQPLLVADLGDSSARLSTQFAVFDQQ
jgi:hypothetical protein